MSSWLIGRTKYFISMPVVELALGDDEARIVSIIHHFIDQEHNEKIIEGRKWTYSTYRKWRIHAPKLSERTIQRKILKLEETGIVLSIQPNHYKGDDTKWYSLNYELIEELTPKWNAAYKRFCDEINTKTPNVKLSPPPHDKLAPPLKTEYSHDLNTHKGICKKDKNIDYDPAGPNPVVSSCSDEFEERWKRFYKLQNRGSKKEAFKMWKKMKNAKNKEDQLDIPAIDKALTAMETLKAHCKATGEKWLNVHYFVRWLSNQNWKDDYSPSEIPPNGKALPGGKKPYQRDSRAIEEQKETALCAEIKSLESSLMPVEAKRQRIVTLLKDVKNKTRRNMIQDIIDNLK